MYLRRRSVGQLHGSHGAFGHVLRIDDQKVRAAVLLGAGTDANQVAITFRRALAPRHETHFGESRIRARIEYVDLAGLVIHAQPATAARSPADQEAIAVGN